MNAGCDWSDDADERCGYHHPTEQTNVCGKTCCCGAPWLTTHDRCGSGATEGEADKTYLEWLKLQVKALRSDLSALTAKGTVETR